MFLITLNKVKNTDILKKIYVDMFEFKLPSQVFLIYVPDLINRTYNINNLISNVIKVNAKDFKGIDEVDIEDIMYDLAENKGNIIFDYKGCSKALRKQIEEIIEEVGLEVIDIDDQLNVDKIDLSCLSFNDLNIIYEFFDIEKTNTYYTPKDFLIRLVINDKGEVRDEITKEKVGSLKKKSLIEILLNHPFDIEDRLAEVDSIFKDSILSNALYEPWAFLQYDKGLNQKIYDYKATLFEKIKDIHPEEYECLPEELVDVLNSNSYIQFSDIMDIISKKDEILQYY